MDRVKVNAEMRERILRELEQENREESTAQREDIPVEENKDKEGRENEMITEKENPEDEKQKDSGSRKLSFLGRMNKITAAIAAVLALVLIGSGVAYVSLKSGSDVTMESAAVAEDAAMNEAAEATAEQVDEQADESADKSIPDQNEALAAANGSISGGTGGRARTDDNVLNEIGGAAGTDGNVLSGTGDAGAANEAAVPAAEEGTDGLETGTVDGGFGGGAIGIAEEAVPETAASAGSSGTAAAGNTTATTAADTIAAEEAADQSAHEEKGADADKAVSLVHGSDISVKELIKMVSGNVTEYVLGGDTGTSSAILPAQLAGYEGEVSLKWKNSVIESAVWRKTGSEGSLDELRKSIRAEVGKDGKIGEDGAYVWNASGRKIKLTPNLMIEITME